MLAEYLNHFRTVDCKGESTLLFQDWENLEVNSFHHLLEKCWTFSSNSGLSPGSWWTLSIPSEKTSNLCSLHRGVMVCALLASSLLRFATEENHLLWWWGCMRVLWTLWCSQELLLSPRCAEILSQALFKILLSMPPQKHLNLMVQLAVCSSSLYF